jgi:mannitol-1-phosphate 5-dehydrogenase
MERHKPFLPWEHLKLYIHNMGHFVAGALCLNEGVEHLDAIPPQLAEVAIGAMREAAMAIRIEHCDQFSQRFLDDHLANLWQRMTNPELHDECVRLVDDLPRKLEHRDRMVGAAELCLRHKIVPENILTGFHAALKLDDHRVGGSAELQAIFRDSSLEGVLEQVCGLRPYDPLWIALGGRETW